MQTATVLTSARHSAVNPNWAAQQRNGTTLKGLAALGQIGIAVSYARNATIFNEGDSAENSYRVISGAVRLCKVLPDGRRQIADFFLPGDFFALGGFHEHLFTAEAVTDAAVVTFPRRRVERLCDEVPEMRNELLSRAYRDLSATQNHLVMLGCQSAKERVASFVLLLAKRAQAEDGDTIELPMGRQDIADYLGLTIETVCRALSDLKRGKLITTPNTHQVVVDDSEALRALTENEI